MKKEKPKIACLPNGPYYLLNDMMPKAIPNIQTSKGGPCLTITGKSEGQVLLFAYQSIA